MNAVLSFEVLPEWMCGKAIKAVMGALDSLGAEPEAMFVGGCVRNELMGIAVKDLDIATRFLPDEVTLRMSAAGIKCIPTGIEHGTVSAIIDGQQFEITTLRRDVETDGRHAVVAFSDDWLEDAQRRDFTMNALYADMRGCVYDPVGLGVSDLEKRRVVFVGDAEARVEEDTLRVLRYFRFLALYGEGEVDAAALKACHGAADKLAELSKERVTQEVLKILKADRLADVLELMCWNNVLPEISGVLNGRDTLKRLMDLQRNVVMSEPMYLLRLLAFSENVIERINMMVGLMALSNKQKDYLRKCCQMRLQPGRFGLDEARIRAYFGGKDITLGWAQLRCVTGDVEDFEAVYRDLEAWDVPSLPIGGQDVMDLGIPAGKMVGEKLREVEAWWCEKDFELSREECMDYLKSC